MLRSIILVALVMILWHPSQLRAQTVKTGDEILSEDGFQALRGKKFALVTNQSAMVTGCHLLDLMKRDGVQPTVIFTPEHGLDGKAEDGVHLADGTAAGIPVKSLYGDSRTPCQGDLSGLDLVVFDIQDVGVRFYTYISTMGLVMQASARAGVPFWVLDRPNPLGGDYVAGFVRRSSAATFTSLYPVPIAHGMTVGELAMMIKGEGMLPGLSQLRLGVIRMQGWKRWMRWPDTGLPWVATSPNLASFDSALLYPGTGLLEATGASMGRGTSQPFRLVGWPGIDAKALAKRLNSEGLPGLFFEPAKFTPVSIHGVSSDPRYRDREVSGVWIEITDYKKVLPVEAGVAVIDALYDAVPKPERKLFFRGLEEMAGSDLVRKGVETGAPPRGIDASWGTEIRDFCGLRQRYLLYGD